MKKLSLNEISDFLEEESEKLQEELELLELNEMSQAFGDKEYQVNVWVEPKNKHEGSDKYFKYSDNSSYTKATKCCRINIEEPTVQYHKNIDRKMDWILTEKDKRDLVELLSSTYSEIYKMTHWQQVLFTFNSDRFQMKIDEFLRDDWGNKKEYEGAYHKDFPMPDYMLLSIDPKLCKNKIAKR